MSKKSTVPQYELGAIILTVINLGQDALLFPLTKEQDIRRLWSRFLAQAKVADMEETSWEEELAYWEKQLRDKDRYSIDTVKEYATWLLEDHRKKNRRSNGVSR